MLSDELRLVEWAPPGITIAHDARQSRDQLALIPRRLAEWTNQDWRIDFITQAGGQTLRESEIAADAARLAAAATDPVVQALMSAFPGAELTDVETTERIPHAQSR